MLTWYLASTAVFLVVILIASVKKLALPFILWSVFGLGCLLQGILGGIGLTFGKTTLLWQFPSWPVLGRWGFALDPLASLMFLLLGAIGLAASLVAAQHSFHKSPGTGRGMATIAAIQYLFTGCLVTANNAIPLLIGWETMSLCAYAYILVNHYTAKARRAAYVTLFVSELGFLMLVLAVALAAPHDGNFGFSALAGHLQSEPPALRDGVLLLALFGFGTKSGVFPTQVWMPDAYDVSPPHLAAILAGGLLNLGIFGILRFVVLGGTFSLWVGVLIVCLGAVAVFSGALFAVIEERIRRLLAYSSAENVGFMIISLGLSLLFTASHNPQFAAVALAALFIQMVSHALAKALAFLTTGEVARTIGSANLDDLGGLFRVMPGITVAMLVASLSLAAVAPFSGFASEWLTLQSMLQVYRGLPPVAQILTATAGILTATGAALGLTTFLRLFVFTMTGRLRNVKLFQTLHRHRKEPFVALGVGLLTVLSCFYGWVPTTLIPLYGRLISLLEPVSSTLYNVVPNVFGNPEGNQTPVSLGAGIFSFLPLHGFVIQPGESVASIAPTYVLLWFLFFALLAWLFTKLPRRRLYGRRDTPGWFGGRYENAPAAQYTASAYANPYRMFWAGLLRYRLTRGITESSVATVEKVSLKRQVVPWLTTAGLTAPLINLRRALVVIRKLQHGYLWGYMLTMLVALALLLIWAVV